MKIGHFTSENGLLSGTIVSPLGMLSGVIVAAVQPANDRGPDYVVTTGAGEIGAAWNKTSEKGNAFISVALRSPFLPATVHCVLLESTRDAGVFSLVWNDKKPGKKEEAA